MVVVGLVVAAAVAVTDWWAVATERPEVERWAKPSTMVALTAVAATSGEAPIAVRLALVGGAVFGLIGDIALLGDGESAFIAGLGAFAVGHLLYGAGATMLGVNIAWAAGGAVVVATLLAYRFATETLPGARRAGGPVLAGAVVFYALVIAFMVITVAATTIAIAFTGAVLFVVSDWVLGYRRFVGRLPARLPDSRLMVMVPYHLGQALLIIGLLTG